MHFEVCPPPWASPALNHAPSQAPLKRCRVCAQTPARVRFGISSFMSRAPEHRRGARRCTQVWQRHQDRPGRQRALKRQEVAVRVLAGWSCQMGGQNISSTPRRDPGNFTTFGPAPTKRCAIRPTQVPNSLVFAARCFSFFLRTAAKDTSVPKRDLSLDST